jgi:hypothetical protein
MPTRRRVRLADGGQVTAIAYCPTQASVPRLIATLVLAHGAGADQEHSFLVDVAGRLARAGVRTVTFNFPYTESGRRAPDRAAVLQGCFLAVLADERKRPRGARTLPLFVGGKSLGGRMASHLAADGEPGIAGLVCLGYPLHPPGKPEQLRVAHLDRIRVPVLVVQGSRDPFGGPDEVGRHFRVVPAPVTIFPVEQGDHSFKVPKRVASADAVMGGVINEIVRWMRDVTAAR